MDVDHAPDERAPEADAGAADDTATALPVSDDGNGSSADDAAELSQQRAEENDHAEAPEESVAEDDAPELTLDDPYGMIGERPCPTCDGAGEIPFNVLQSPRFECCDECGGIGTVRTGSLVPESAMQVCEKCNGGGYVATAETFPGPTSGILPETLPVNPPWPGAVFNETTGSWETRIPAA